MKLFDAHFHVIDNRFPLVANEGYIPASFTVEDYQLETRQYELSGGVLVSGSFQAYDHHYLIDALGRLGNRFFGVANIPFDISDSDLVRLHNANVRAVRFNFKRLGMDDHQRISTLANKVYGQFKWHTELYLDNHDLSRLKPLLETIPVFSIDHLGLSQAGLSDFYYWVERGIKVKATGFGRLDFDPVPVMKTIHSINPTALMFGTDLPSTRAKVPFSHRDIELVTSHFSDEECSSILFNNALDFYRKY